MHRTVITQVIFSKRDKLLEILNFLRARDKFYTVGYNRHRFKVRFLKFRARKLMSVLRDAGVVNRPFPGASFDHLTLQLGAHNCVHAKFEIPNSNLQASSKQ